MLADVELIAKGFWKLSKTFKQIKEATNDIRYFQVETTTLSQLIVYFYYTATSCIQNLERGRKKTREKLIQNIVSQFSLASQDIKFIATRLVIPFGSTQAGLQRVIIRLRWHMKKDTIAGLRLRLEGIKSSAQLMMSTAVCEDLKEQIRSLERGQKMVPEEMLHRKQLLTEAIRRANSSARQAVKSIQSFHRSHNDLEDLHHTDVQSLIDTIEEIRQDVSIAVPETMRRSRSHRNHGRPDSTFSHSVAGTHAQEPVYINTQRGRNQVNPISTSRGPPGGPQSFPQPNPDVSLPPASRRTRHNISVSRETPEANRSEPGKPPTIGHRVRDDGRKLSVEVGPWPEHLVGPSRQSPTGSRHEVVEPETRNDHEPHHEARARKGQSIRAREGQDGPGPKTSSPERGLAAEEARGENRRREHGKSLETVDPGKWRPVPPFNQEDLKRRQDSGSHKSDSEDKAD